MDPIDLRTLKILERVNNNDTPSQRDLSRDLNISLGLVNSVIKRLAQKGYFKIGHLPNNRIRYTLTPRGVAEKSRLTHANIQYCFEFYRDVRKKLEDLYAELETQGVRRIIFYGAGELAEIAYISLQQSSIELVAVVDDDRVGKKFMQFTIAHADRIEFVRFDRIIITSINPIGSGFEKIGMRGILASRVLEIG